MLCTALITNVSASTEIALGAAHRANNALSRPQLRILSHSSGKIIILSMDSSSHLFVKVISSLGVILAITQITTPTTIDAIGSIAEYNVNNVIITCGSHTGTTGSGTINFYFIIFNINTFTQTSYSHTWGVYGTSYVCKIGQLHYYNGVWYTTMYRYSYNSGSEYVICKFTVSTTTVSHVCDTAYADATTFSEIMTFQDSNDLKMLYLVFAPTGTTPNYYKFDCSSDTLSLLATNPFANEYPTLTGYRNVLTYMGGGIYQSGTFYYLYHTWCFSFLSGATTGIREVKTIHWTGEFNNSITSGTLISQVRKEQISVDSSGSTLASSGISWGYLRTTVGMLGQDIYVHYQDIYAGKYTSRDTLHITDITAMNGSFDMITTLRGADGLDFTFKNQDANIGKNPMYGVSYQEVDDSNSYLYIGESAMTVNFTETFSYSPVDNPLLTGKTYTLTWTIYKNGIIDYSGDTYQFFYDGVSMKTGILDSNGKAIISIMINIAGPHSFQIKIYDTTTGAELFAGLVRNYTVSASVPPGGTIPSSPVLTTYYTDLFMFWIPIGMIVFLPMMSLTLAGAKYAGGAGAITGMIFGGMVGVIGGTVVGIIPMYALYLLVILIATGLVMLIVRGSSGGGNAEP
jgi:hypothetical protein